MAHSASYPKILALGNQSIADIFETEVEITEKVDGSQIGFGMIGGELVVRSKGKEQDIENPDKMFAEGVAYIKSIADRIPDDAFFYGEYLSKPRHSTLAYDRIPKNHIVLFGARHEDHTFLSYNLVAYWAKEFGVDAIPLIYAGVSNPEHALSLVDGESYLGGQQREGIVVKAYKPWLWMNIPLTVMAGKFVSEKFKEVHEKDWTRLNTGKGKMDSLKDKYHTEARWHKAIMHLKERGTFDGSLKDIGPLIKEIKSDIELEEKENIKHELYSIYKDDILRYATLGFPEWYKLELAKGNLS